MSKQIKRGKWEKPPKDLRWCIHPDCDLHAERQFLSITGLKGLEDHWVEKHGASQKPAAKKTKIEPTELFDRQPYLRG